MIIGELRLSEIVIDKGLADQVYVYCNFCENRLSGDTCTAFPDGIPDKFIKGKEAHTKPIKGDNGIIFKAINK